MKPATAVALLLVGALAACGGDDGVVSVSGTLEVVVTTSGESLDADGYGVVVDESASRSVSANDTLGLVMSPGTYSVELTGIADNCATSGDNPVSATVTSDATTSVAFTVTCTAS